MILESLKTSMSLVRDYESKLVLLSCAIVWFIACYKIAYLRNKIDRIASEIGKMISSFCLFCNAVLTTLRMVYVAMWVSAIIWRL